MNEALFLLNAIYEDATTIGEYFELNLENRYILRSLILIKIILSVSFLCTCSYGFEKLDAVNSTQKDAR